MASIQLTDNTSTTAITTDALVVGISHSQDSKKLQIESANLRIESAQLLRTLEAMGVTGVADEVTKLPGVTSRLLVFTGLGLTSTNYPHEKLRRAAGAAARALAGIESATFALPNKTLAEMSAISEGALLGAYAFDEFRGSSKKDRKSPLAKVTIFSTLAKSNDAKSAIKRAQVISENTFIVRDLINTPPSHLTPESFCTRFKKIAGTSGVKVKIFTAAELKAKGYGGIVSVGQGSANPPRLLHMSYTPKGANKNTKRYAFVGKGITFDSGGLALKPALGMEAMKSDMSGAAAVCAAILAIAQLKLPIAIESWAPLAENMISDNATRPSDIITIYGGKTIEVLNPDAEGRLVLADALVKAAEVGKKLGRLDGIIDVATLTGAQVVALGTRTSAVMTNNEEFRDQFLAATAESGEQFWPMPLPEELRASLDSPVADMANIGDKMGGMLVAGLFLKEFVDPEMPWLHLDIAGPAYNESKPHGYTPVGGTGVALRSLVTFAESASRS